MKDQVIKKLKELTGKENIVLLEKGNTAIREIIKLINKKRILIQDQGGWIIYKTLPGKIVEVKTDYGVIDLEDLKEKIEKNSVLLVNSLSGYFAEQSMQEIEEICKDKCILVNDVSGSIGTELGKVGDFIVGSFGRWKPINLYYGGFIASNNKLKIKENFENKKLPWLNEKIDELPERLEKLKKIVKKVKEDLSKFEILHKDSYSLNVIVKFNNEEEKEEILKYCQDNEYEYYICPAYIKVNEDAVSIEVKRIG